ncbi:MAG TPA: monovalent cation/H(+) antiporter subunit G [Burkholderiaceae bacterium]|jgi:multicomponent K+:H+ antiporter subunit G
MSPIEGLPAWAALPVALLLVLGGVISLVGALGLLRLPTFYQRMHGPAVIVALGAGCILCASMLVFTLLEHRLVIHELLIGALLPMTAPLVAMQVVRAAVHRDLQSGRREPGAPAELYRPVSDAPRDSEAPR